MNIFENFFDFFCIINYLKNEFLRFLLHIVFTRIYIILNTKMPSKLIDHFMRQCMTFQRNYRRVKVIIYIYIYT